MNCDPSSWQYEKLERAIMTDNCQSTFEKIKHCLMQPPILSSPLLEKNCICTWLYRSGQLELFYSAALAQGAETYLLRQQSVGDVETRYSKMGPNGLGPSKCRPKAQPLLPSPPGDRAN
ncbi:hypothetical protein CK203_021924 [Vitis vinifera]|uniref:Uncharacterized protein n=1 Tax=Vitis vinifera TaxID=29760 RepID=A0A438JFC6_VITVI|nr:hypothetical protein CK203_021924 [Vitis vinifera]